MKIFKIFSLQVLKGKLDSPEAMCGSLVTKLEEAEARLSVLESVHHYCLICTTFSLWCRYHVVSRLSV